MEGESDESDWEDWEDVGPSASPLPEGVEGGFVISRETAEGII